MKLIDIITQNKRKKQKEKCMRDVKMVTASVVIGSVTGIVTGLLVAPKSGKETRKEIVNTSKSITSNMTNKVTDCKDQLSDAKLKIRSYIEERKNKCCSPSEDVVSDFSEKNDQINQENK